MVRIFFYHLFMGILVNGLVLMVSMMPGLMIPSGLGAALTACAVAAVISLFSLLCMGKTYVTRYKSEKYKEQSVFLKRKVKLIEIFYMTIPFYILAVIFLIFGILKMPNAAETLVDKNSAPNMSVLVSVFLLSSAVFWTEYSLLLLPHYKKTKCECGGMRSYVQLSYEEGGFGREETRQSVRNKSRNTYGTTAIWVDGDGNQVGEETGITGSQNYQKITRTTKRYVTCRCVFCKNTKEFLESSETKSWNSYS